MNFGGQSANYEYGPFGEVIRATGPMAKLNPFRYQTKYQDDETDFLYYGYRYYNPSTGRWLSRDPAKEGGGNNLYGIVANDPLNSVDMLGLWAWDVHHKIVEDWLSPGANGGTDYHQYHWHCCLIDVIKALQDGSDDVDGTPTFFGFLGWDLHWCEAQSSANSYQHAMRNGAINQSVAAAQAQYQRFLVDNESEALSLESASQGDCSIMYKAIRSLGHAYHSYSDSLSPAHAGFQPWWGPFDGIDAFGYSDYMDMVSTHEAKETLGVYNGMKSDVVGKVRGYFQTLLNTMLNE